MSIRWFRSGSSVKKWREEGTIDRFIAHKKGRDLKGMRMRFSISAAGGGTTELMIIISKDEYPNLLAAMNITERTECMMLRLENERLKSQIARLTMPAFDTVES